MHRSLIAFATVLLALAVPAAAQSSGFREGEIFIYTKGLQGPGYTGAGILRIDPASGASSVFTQVVGGYSSDFAGGIAFDPYRQRLVFCAGIGSGTNHLWLADGNGNLQNMSSQYPLGIYLNSLAPTGDGRIYCRHDAGSTPNPLLWYDAQDVLHVLYDTDGITPMRIDGNASYYVQGMIHDAATNSLFVASHQPAPGFPDGRINVRKLPLSQDGSRVIGPVGNVQFDVSVTATQYANSEVPVGWSHGPNGQLVLCVLCIDSLVLPRMLLVDPLTSAVTVWGSNGQSTQPGAYSMTHGGAYTTALDEVVIVDYSNNVLRAYAQGSAGGPGTVLATSPATITQGASYLNVISIPDDHCTGSGAEYGTGLAGTGGFVPRLASNGCPDWNHSVAVVVDRAVGGAFGVLLLGSAPASLPLFGGTLLVAPIDATVVFPCTGTLGAPGAGAFQLPLLLADPALAGRSFYFQAGLLDAAASQGFSITNGLRLTIG